MSSQPARQLRARDVLGTVGAQPDQSLTTERDTPELWDPVLPLTPRRVLPAFPVEHYPPWLRDMVDELTIALQVPPDLPATLALAGLAVAAGGRVDVTPRPGWVEPTNLYTVVALVPGSRKSPCFSAMTRPLYAAEQVLVDSSETERLQASLLARRAQAQAEQAAKIAEQAGSDEAMAEALTAAEQAREHTEFVEPRLLADDLTPETAATLLAHHGGRLGLLSAEGGSFTTIAGTRYSANANLEPLLKAHAGDSMRIDRKGRPSERIERPALTIAITTQPAQLASITGTPQARERGLLARFLYSLPVNTVGRREINPPPLSDPTRQAYEAHLATLVVDLHRLETRTELTCTYDAARVLDELAAWLEPRLDPDTGELASVADWASKMAGTAARLAGLLHLAHHGDTGIHAPITAETMTSAVHLAHYYLAHASAALDILTTNPDVDVARRIHQWITTTQPATFTRRELHRALESKTFARAADLDPGLDLLIERGHLREYTTIGPKGGRPSITYHTHPDLTRPT